MDGRFWTHIEKSNITVAQPNWSSDQGSIAKITKRPSLPTAAPDEEH